ncbi:hypothetical protein EI94DRAFT_1740320 [Lactarius quietus]|nr:hypothetical protein EI94DRAFT_1740320 [Lactarius quietus]
MVSSPAAIALNHPVVVSFITSHVRVSDLPSLCLTTKSFHSSATRRLYHSLILTKPSTAFLACETLARTASLATHVRSLVLGQGPLNVWQALQRALEALPRLEAFAIDARGIRLSWLAEDCRQPSESARLRGAADTAAEVANPTAEVADPNLNPNAEPESETLDLPLLNTVECPLSLAYAFARSPLTHLQVLGDSGPNARATDRDANLLHLIPRLACAHKTLRSLSLYEVPEARTADVIALAAEHCPQLRYLGLLPLPIGPRTAVHEALTCFEALVMLEFELSTWSPLPTGALQRILVTELHTFCPSLRTVSLWLSSRRFVWRHNADTGVWEGQVDQRGLTGWKTV